MRKPCIERSRVTVLPANRMPVLCVAQGGTVGSQQARESTLGWRAHSASVCGCNSVDGCEERRVHEEVARVDELAVDVVGALDEELHAGRLLAGDLVLDVAREAVQDTARLEPGDRRQGDVGQLPQGRAV